MPTKSGDQRPRGQFGSRTSDVPAEVITKRGAAKSAKPARNRNRVEPPVVGRRGRTKR